MPKRFAKYHGLGNDFVIIDAREDGLISAAQAVLVCDRRRGIGADGVLSILPSQAGADFGMHIFNADGSVAEMCGNGLRCVVQYMARATGNDRFLVWTAAGLRVGSVQGDGRVRVELGAVQLYEEPVRVVSGKWDLQGTRASVGNPHLVLPPFGPETSLEELARDLGPELTHHPAYASGTNVEFVRVHEWGIELVVYERGAGLTLACGTGAAAAVAATQARGLISGDTTCVRLPGGELDVIMTPRGAELHGDAVFVFDGSTRLLDR